MQKAKFLVALVSRKAGFPLRETLGGGIVGVMARKCLILSDKKQKNAVNRYSKTGIGKPYFLYFANFYLPNDLKINLFKSPKNSFGLTITITKKGSKVNPINAGIAYQSTGT